ncbi:MAG: hypothetical protein H0T42_18125 [Deltaproteobacteria bacterium]|nr:hypothetical protein [Deltaproteobacteria bacterium]
MRVAASSVLFLMACQSSGSGDRFPVVVGGDDTVITPAPDAPQLVDASDDMTALSGRVCVIADLRNLTSCTTGDASGITVRLGTSMGTTAMDGSFSLPVPQGSNLVWSVTAPGFVPTVVPLGLVHLLPLVSTARYEEMLSDNGVILQAGQGSLFTRVVRNAAPAVGVTATIDPPTLFGALYDGANAFLWDRDATGTSAVVWIPDALQGTATLTLMRPAATPLQITLPVVDGSITFVTAAIP